MSIGRDLQDHEAPPTVEIDDLGWNTHVVLRRAFGYPESPEYFEAWLDWFYEQLTFEQRKLLRKADLNTLNKSQFPTPTPRTPEEST